MSAPDGGGGKERHSKRSPGREKGRKNQVQCGSETERMGDGAADGGAVILQSHQRSREQHLLIGKLVILGKKINIVNIVYICLLFSS